MSCTLYVLTASPSWPAGIENAEAIKRLAEMCPSLQASVGSVTA